MSRIVLDIELADSHTINELCVSTSRTVQGYRFLPSEVYRTTKQAFWCTRNLHGIVWNSERVDYSELKNFLPEDVKTEHLTMGTEKRNTLSNLKNEIWKTWMIMAVLKYRLEESDKDMWFCSSYPFRHKTTFHCAEQKEKLIGEWTRQHCSIGNFVLYYVLLVSP